MFTVKFVSFFDESSHTETINAICCPNYEVNKFRNRVDVITYPTMTNENGVSRTVTSATEGSADPSFIPPITYQACYIENAQGKTIEHLNCKSL